MTDCSTIAPGLLARWQERLDALRAKGDNRSRQDFVLQLDIIDTLAHLRRADENPPPPR